MASFTEAQTCRFVKIDNGFSTYSLFWFYNLSTFLLAYYEISLYNAFVGNIFLLNIEEYDLLNSTIDM